MTKLPCVITLHSFKGGVGKSWLAMNFSRILSMSGKKILLIESDFAMPTYTHIFSKLNIDVYFNKYLENKMDPLEKFIYKTSNPNLDIICCSPDFKASDNLFSNNQSWFFDRIKFLEQDVNTLDYDCVIFDMSPGFTLFLVNILSITNHALIITRSDVNSIRGSEYLIERVYSKLAVKDNFSLHVIINQIPKLDKFEVLIEDWMIQFRVKFSVVTSITPLYLDEEIIYLSAINEYELPIDSTSYSDCKLMIERIINA